MATIKKVFAVVLSICMMLPLAFVSTAADEYTLTPIADILAMTADSEGEYYVQGEITSIANTSYGNMYIKDAEGNELYIYGLYDSTGATKYGEMTEKPTIGDTILVLSPVTIYSSKAQLKNAKLISYEKGEVVIPDPVEASIVEINAMTQPSGLQEYIVEGMVTSIASTTYGNMYIADANGNELYIYGLYDAAGTVRYDALTEKPDEGDTIKVIAPVTIYGGAAQLTNAKLQSFTAGDLPEVEEPEEPTVEGEKIVFELGENGSASSYDGVSSVSYTETNGDYTLTLTATQQMWTTARDAKGNSTIKLGASSKVGGFNFTVPSDVTSVIIAVAGRATAKGILVVNGVSNTITTYSNNGEYTDIIVDTSATKDVSVTTASGGYRVMINSITYVVPASSGGDDSECEHDFFESEREDATCTEAGTIYYDCDICGAVLEEEIPALGHDMVAGEVVAPTVESEGYTIYTCSRCGATENKDYTDKLLPEGTTQVVFPLGENGTATHADGSEKTTYTETVGDYTLTLENPTKMYTGARDAMGNGAVKLGTGSAKGGFSFTVPAEVKLVIIEVAQYKANETTVNINGTEYVITTSSNNGDYTAIEIDTSSVKTVELMTVTNRAMINSITYRIVASDCEHNYVAEETTAPTCTEAGVITNTCSLCGDSYTEDAPATGHSYVAGETVAPAETEAGYTTYTCSVCGATMNSDFVSPVGPTAPEGTEVVVFEFGDNGDAVHADGSALTAPVDYTSGEFTLSFTTLTKVYGPAFDAKGNSAIKLGTGSATAALEFTVPENVNTVIIRVAGYKANNVEFTINGTTYTVELKSNDGTYYPVVIDTTETKTISLATTAAIDERALIDSITYWVATACEHNYEADTTAPSCGVAGKTVYTCSACGDSYEEEIAALEHNFVAGEIVPPQVGVQGYTVYTCENCGATENRDFTDALPEPEVPDTGDITNIALEATDVDLIVTWTAPADVIEYTWVLKDDATGAELGRGGIAGDKTSYKFSWPTLNYETTYRIGIRAKTAAGWQTTQVVRGALVIGDRVVDVKTESSKELGRKIKVTWKAYEGANKYIVYVFRKGDAQTTANVVTSVEVNDGSITEAYIQNVIAPEVDYTVSVRARVGTNYTGLASALDVDARLGVYAPEAFAVRGNTPNKVAISWDEVRGADKYWVMLTDVETGEQFIRQSLSSMASVPNLTPGKTYSVKLNARITDADGTPHYAGYSVVLGEITTKVWEDLNVTADENGNVTWSAHTDAAVYYVYRKEGTGSYKKIATLDDPGMTSYTDASAKAGKTYTYAIKVKVANDLISTNSELIKGAPVTIA